MNLTSLIVGAAAGALSVLVARLFGHPGLHRNRYIGAYIVSFALLFAVGENVVTPWFELRQAQSELRKMPVFRAIEQHDPETYAAIETEIDRTLRERGDKKELMARLRPLMTGVVLKRLPQASDEAVRAYIDVTMTEVDELMARADTSCHEFLFPQGDGLLDPMKYFSAETQQADLVALGRVLETAGSDPQAVPQEADIMPQLQSVYGKTSEEFGQEQVMLLANPHTPGVDKRQLCVMTARLYDHILSLPTEEGGRLLRFMLAK